MKISFKLMVSFIMIAAFIGIASTISINFSHESLSDSIGQSSLLVSSEIINHVDREIYNRIEEFELLSKDLLVQQTILFSNKEFETLGNVQEYIDKKDKEWVSSPKKEITPFMKQIIDNKLSDELRKSLMFFEEKYGYNVLGEIFVTNAYGANVAQTGKTTDYKQDDEDWWRMAKDKGLYVRDVEFDESAGVYSTDIGIRVEDDTKNFLGVIKVVLNIEEAINIIKEVEGTAKYQNSQFTLLNGKSEVIYSTKGFGLFEDVSNYPFYGKIEGKSGYFVSDKGTQDENEKLFAYSRSEGYRDYKGLGWILILEHEKAEVLKEANELRDSLWVISTVVVGLALLMGIFASRTISRPLTKLKKFTEKVAAGNMDESIESSGNDEIHDLTSSFDFMVKSLNKSKKELVVTEKKYRTLYDESPVLYRTINKDGIIINCNKTYTKSLGYSKDELIGSSIFMTIDENSLDAMKNSFETWRSTGRVKNREVWLKRKNGSTFPTLIAASNLYDANNKLVGSNTVIQDITEIYEARKKVEEDALLKLQLTEFKKLDKLKDEFASMITHELKTPLATIKGHCEILKELGTNDRFHADDLGSINEIHKSTFRLERLIEDVLDVQKLEMGRMSFYNKKFNITEFLSEVEKDFSPTMKEKEIKFVNSTKEELTVVGDKYRIRQVIDNLVLNSIDFMPKRNKRIEVGVKSEDHKIVFYVKDNGTGIPSEMQPLLFRKFYQTDTSPRRKHPGTGLGLVVCKGIVEGMGGRIWFKSKVGKETSFYFSIPIKEKGFAN